MVPTPLTDISLKPVSGQPVNSDRSLDTSPFMGSNPVSRTQPSVNERFGLLATVDVSGHGISLKPTRLRITYSGLLGDWSFALG